MKLNGKKLISVRARSKCTVCGRGCVLDVCSSECASKTKTKQWLMPRVTEAPACAKGMSWKHEGKTGPVYFTDSDDWGSPVARYTEEWFTLAQARRIAKRFALPLEQV